MSKFFGGGKKDNSAARLAEEQRQREALRQQHIAEGMSAINGAFAGFDDPFYQSRSKAYIDYANPQVEDQFNDKKKALIFALSRGGKLNSTVAAERNRRLQEELGRARETITSTGQNYATDARRNVADARSSLISLLNATEDPAAAREEAVRRATLESQPPAFSPLGNLFSDVTAGLDRIAGPQTGYQGFVGGPGLFQDRGRRRSGQIVN